MNNPTLTEFCFGMIGRADIEGSKSNVAMNAWLPQASSLLPAAQEIAAPTASRPVRPVGGGFLSEGNSPYLRPAQEDGPTPWRALNRPTALRPPSRLRIVSIHRIVTRPPLRAPPRGVTAAAWYRWPLESSPHPGVSPYSAPKDARPEPARYGSGQTRPRSGLRGLGRKHGK